MKDKGGGSLPHPRTSLAEAQENGCGRLDVIDTVALARCDRARQRRQPLQRLTAPEVKPFNSHISARQFSGALPRRRYARNAFRRLVPIGLLPVQVGGWSKTCHAATSGRASTASTGSLRTAVSLAVRFW